MAVENSGISLFPNIPQAQSTTYSRAESSASSTELTMTDFYQLLAAQFKYQDADNPMDTSQMMAQMVQTQMISALTHMTTAINDLSLVNTTTYAVSMVGNRIGGGVNHHLCGFYGRKGCYGCRTGRKRAVHRKSDCRNRFGCRAWNETINLY